ncbi:MAG: hypothetical protein U5N58_02185 [Actinomycetota bacterium]|nr:hypothetical protein [Actinomycetota bacterium]
MEENARLVEPALDRNRLRWPYNPELVEEDTGLGQELEYMQQYIQERTAWLDRYIGSSLQISIGGREATINHESNTIFCALEPGAGTLQTIDTSLEDDVPIHIKPLSYGSFNMGHLEEREAGFRKAEEELSLDNPDDRLTVNIESLEQGQTVSGLVKVTGWAVDQQSHTGPGIESVYLSDGPLAIDRYLGQADYGLAREDVAAELGDSKYTDSGFPLPLIPSTWKTASIPCTCMPLPLTAGIQ